MQTPYPDARIILAKTEPGPQLRRLVWAALATARGIRVNQFRLIQMQRERGMTS